MSSSLTTTLTLHAECAMGIGAALCHAGVPVKILNWLETNELGNRQRNCAEVEVAVSSLVPLPFEDQNPGKPGVRYF
jgi:hypothetical protein